MERKTCAPMNNKITVIFVEPEKNAVVTNIESTFEEYRKFLGGDFKQICPFEDDVALLINENEKFNNSAPNRALIINHRINDILHGSFFVCGMGEENYSSLSKDLISKYLKMFYYPERFEIGENGIIRFVQKNIFVP